MSIFDNFIKTAQIYSDEESEKIALSRKEKAEVEARFQSMSKKQRQEILGSADPRLGNALWHSIGHSLWAGPVIGPAIGMGMAAKHKREHEEALEHGSLSKHLAKQVKKFEKGHHGGKE